MAVLWRAARDHQVALGPHTHHLLADAVAVLALGVAFGHHSRAFDVEGAVDHAGALEVQPVELGSRRVERLEKGVDEGRVFVVVVVVVTLSDLGARVASVQPHQRRVRIRGDQQDGVALAGNSIDHCQLGQVLRLLLLAGLVGGVWGQDRGRSTTSTGLHLVLHAHRVLAVRYLLLLL